jgi:thymidylate synthase
VERAGMTLPQALPQFNTEHDTMNLCYLDLLLRVMSAEADIVSPRGRQTRELRPALFTLRNPRLSIITSKARNLNQAFAAAEFCWIMAGDDLLHPLAAFNSRMAEFADCGFPHAPYFYGAYGPRVVEQLPHVLKALRADDSSRQAVLSIWRPNPPKTKDVPCTLTLQFLIRHGHLELITSMRSNDLMLGTPYDVQTFTRLQLYVASQLGVAVGPYHHLVGSLHLYSDDVPKAEAIIAEIGDQSAADALPDFDPTVAPHALWAAVRKGAIPATWDAVKGWGPLAVTMREYLERKAARAARATP